MFIAFWYHHALAGRFGDGVFVIVGIMP